MYFTTFTKWLCTELQTICKKDIVDSNENPIKCLGCIGVYA